MRGEREDASPLRTELVRSDGLHVWIGHSEPLGENELLDVSWGKERATGAHPHVPVPAGILLGLDTVMGRVRTAGPVKLKYIDENGETTEVEVPLSVLLAVTRAVVSADLRRRLLDGFDKHVEFGYGVGETTPLS